LSTQARALQRQAQARGIDPREAQRLRSEANDLLNQASAIGKAQRDRVEAEAIALNQDFELKLLRPGDVSKATRYKDDPTFYDPSDEGRIKLITVSVRSHFSRETSREQATAWMDKVFNAFDYEALKALLR
jgi:hypothetical protein